VATDASGDVYVGDNHNHRIQKFSSTGTYISQWGSFGSGDGQFNSPAGVAIDVAGDCVYVADYAANHRIEKFGPGVVSIEATTWGRIKTTYAD
jgi:DNA-binding beta-propeller fold protein YncE